MKGCFSEFMRVHHGNNIKSKFPAFVILIWLSGVCSGSEFENKIHSLSLAAPSPVTSVYAEVGSSASSAPHKGEQPVSFSMLMLLSLCVCAAHVDNSQL